MGPSVGSIGMMARAQATADEVDVTTKWWDDYPTSKYMEMARPQEAYCSYLTNVWSKSKRLARSASYTNLTYIREAEHDYPIRRSSSVSSLAPSLALPQHFRQAERIVHTVPVYKPHIYNWYSKAYSPAKWIDTHETIRRPLYRTLAFEPYPHSSHVPYYNFQTERIFANKRLEDQISYVQGSQRYLDKYVSARLKADDFAQHYAYTAYEWRTPQISFRLKNTFNKHPPAIRTDTTDTRVRVS
ncbi:hypothetical protein Tcan_03646 [Toxocara canis]|uniref:Uncharacterized protein n=1 Tax=Toxocara canis TaxID=6265 RepID=A0A0B2VI85_TOXCA|nr:hypothetical protein Tcan_03646 [Toxocara canis]